MKLIHQRINGRLPFIGVGKLYTADDIAQAWETGWAEFIALGKTVMLNPDLIELIANGRDARRHAAGDGLLSAGEGVNNDRSGINIRPCISEHPYHSNKPPGRHPHPTKANNR